MTIRKFGCWTAGILICIAPELLAATTARLQLVSAGNNIMGGDYTNPYTATIDGVSTQVICDDFKDQTYLGETWTADVYDLATVVNGGVTTRLMANYTPPLGTTWAQLYEEAAYLAVKLMNVSNSNAPDKNTTVGQISFALWGLFDLTALDKLTGNNLSQAQAFKAEAQAAIQNGQVNLSNILLYTPTGSGQCGGSPCGTPQEMLVVKMPEPSAVALLMFDLSAVGGLLYFVRRRQTRPAK